MQRSGLVLGAIHNISAFVNDTLFSGMRSMNHPNASDSFVEFRSQTRSCEEWEKEVLEVYVSSKSGDYGSHKTRISREKVVELRAYKEHTSSKLYQYLVAAISAMHSPGHHVYFYLRAVPLNTHTLTTVVKRLDAWPSNNALLVEQTCFDTDRLPVLLDLILLAPIVSSMSDQYLFKDYEFFFSDLILRALQELFHHTCPKREARYTDPTFVILDGSPVKQREFCFVLPFRSKLLDEIEPLFIEKRRNFGLHDTPKPARFKRMTPPRDKGKRKERQVIIAEEMNPDRHWSERPSKREVNTEGSMQGSHAGGSRLQTTR
ncbi:hypothetical protein C0995_000719 [Termitomyces sp. Mi166|nr:hypothetical protein C0995_000719 [Termitomyces sp. Mi166\